MAEKTNLPNQAAEDTVFGNLGLTREDLGVTAGEDLGSGNEDLQDQGSGNEDVREPDQPEPRVTHTPGIPSGAEVRPDGKGNLIGPDGKIVARAGKEARLYQDLHKTRGQAQTLQGQVSDVTERLRKAVEIGQNLHRELTTARQHNDSVKQFGLEQTEHLTALRLFKELRDNPQAALKNLLTRAAANGINISELGAAAGVDPKSLIDLVRQEIGNAVGPLKERTEAERQQAARVQQETEQRTRVESEIQTFFGQNPEAQQYLPVFTQTIKQFPGMTLGEVWARIQLHFAKNPQDSRSQNSPRRSLPSGRPAPMNGPDDVAPVSDSYEAIVRAAMDRSGIK